MDRPETDTFKPPYMPFATFWNFISNLAARPLPPRIDRSMMSGKSGTDQANILATLKAFGLINAEQKVDVSLTDLAGPDEATRREKLAHILRLHYPGPVSVSEQNGTEDQLTESFRDGFGLTAADTRRKCVTFFLHAAREAGLPISANFPQTRAGSGGPGVPKSKPTKSGSSKSKTPAAAPAARTAKGDSYSVSLRSGGTVSVEVSVNLFDLSTKDRTFVISLVDALKGYDGEQEPARTAGVGEDQ